VKPIEDKYEYAEEFICSLECSWLKEGIFQNFGRNDVNILNRILVYKTTKPSNEEAFSASEYDKKSRLEREVRFDPESKKESGSRQEKLQSHFMTKDTIPYGWRQLMSLLKNQIKTPSMRQSLNATPPIITNRETSEKAWYIRRRASSPLSGHFWDIFFTAEPRVNR